MLLQRPLPLDRHPVANREYRIPTPTIEAFYLLIQRSLRFKIPGSIIYGRSRFGKSRAIEFLEHALTDKDKSLPLLKLACQRKKVPSEPAFFSNLLRAAQHAAPTGGSVTALRTRLHNRLREIADRHRSNRIILFADDAQRLAEIEYEWLQEVFEGLARHRIALITFLVGTPPLRGQKALFQSSPACEQIVARFMVDELPFRGLLSAQDVATCLHAYDATQCPPASGWSYVRFFLPRAVEAGLILAEQGATLWDAFVEAHRQAHLPGDVEIPMEYFTRCVEYALTENIGKDSDKFRLDRRSWDEAIKFSGFAKALELISPGSAEP